MIKKQNNNWVPLCSMTILVLLLSLLPTSAWSKMSLEKMRLGQGKEQTRVVFEIKENHRFKISTLKNPARIVVDFYQSENKLTFSKMKFLDARLKQARVKNQSNRTRVVLDLRDDFEWGYFTLAKNNAGNERVVIDIKNTPAKPEIAKTPRKPHAITKAAVPKKQPAKPAIKAAVKPKSDISQNTHTQAKMDKSSDIFVYKNKDLVVAIDAGHGGKDTGAIGYGGLYEKDVILNLAFQLKKRIDAQPGMRAVLTRDKDVFIPLHKRVRKAREQDADIFLSLHADAFHDKRARGGSVYILSTSGASSVMARLLAKSENASLQDVKLKGRDADVAFVLSDLTRSANIRASRKLAKAVLGEMGQAVYLHKKSVQSADFTVLKSIDMPSLLIETAFISNPSEAKKLKSVQFQAQMAQSIVEGLEKFVSQNGSKPRWGEQLYVHYRVQRGDTLSEIAANYNLSTYQLKKLNHIRKANDLKVGQKLRIPLSEELVAGL
ncbi:MAG: N-acetylmuramoyl-L-alanine amidase [Thiomicrospira sp. CG2_30_44_34]|nr:MAG: N-acetylmuramoyl-L-alanine amidase [Thiomicrospira sp. CG2_30_44_34]